MEPIHLRPTAELAERALLPGDPGRALLLAQALFEGTPRMFNHHRGLWGYTGVATDGAPLTVQATGMGGPSAAIVLEELAELGLRRAVRTGTCGALPGSGLALGDLVVAGEALCADGTSRALGAGERVRADPAVTAALDGRAATVASSDVFYDRDPGRADAWRAAGAVAVEMEAAALFRVGELRGVAVGCVLGVTDLLDGGRERIGEGALEALGVAVGRAALAALPPA